MLVVGLTGNIASGKSTVARLLAEKGLPVIDADILARDAVAPGSAGLDAVIARWGRRVLDANGSLNRGALRQIVFADPEERAALDRIVHPAVRARRDTLVAAARDRGERVVLCVIPLLFETGLDTEMDVIVFINAPRTIRLERIVRDRGLTAAEASAMIDAQLPAGPKRGQSDYVIDNDSTPEALRARVDTTWHLIERDHLA